MKEHENTTLHLQKVHGRCRVVFLCSFISALFLYLFQVHPYLVCCAGDEHHALVLTAKYAIPTSYIYAIHVALSAGLNSLQVD